MSREFNSYEKVSVATDIVVLTTDNMIQENKRKVADKKLQVLLIKRDEEPYENMWSIPGGFVNPQDSLIDCVVGKLKQKAGLSDVYLEQLYTYGDNIERDERGRVITVSYMALTPKCKVTLDKHTKEAEWFWVEDCTEHGIIFRSIDGDTIIKDLAFDHKQIIQDSLNRLRNKIMYTNVGFNLLNELFTIKELQSVFEVILGREISGFRKLIMPRIEETEYITGGAYRPARLFRKRVNTND